MNSKSENNKYDIVSEAEAILAAYNDRCRVYTTKSKRRGKAKRRTIVALAILALALGAYLYLHFYL